MSSSRTRVPAASGPTTFEHPTPGWTYPGTAPGPAEARHDSASPPAAPVTQPAALELGPDGVPYIRKPDGSRNGLVETTTGPGGEVEFSEEVANAIAALGATGADDASAINFQQAGTGAIVRTVQDKMREAASFKDFGVVGDGLTDDSINFEKAIRTGRVFKMDGENILISSPISNSASTIITGRGTLKFAVTSRTAITCTGDVDIQGDIVLDGTDISNELIRATGSRFIMSVREVKNIFQNSVEGVRPIIIGNVDHIRIFGTTFKKIATPANGVIGDAQGACQGILINGSCKSGKVYNCRFEDINNRSEAGGTLQFEDADAVLCAVGASKQNISVFDCEFENIGKRFFKATGTPASVYRFSNNNNMSSAYTGTSDTVGELGNGMFSVFSCYGGHAIANDNTFTGGVITQFFDGALSALSSARIKDNYFAPEIHRYCNTSLTRFANIGVEVPSSASIKIDGNESINTTLGVVSNATSNRITNNKIESGGVGVDLAAGGTFSISGNIISQSPSAVWNVVSDAAYGVLIRNQAVSGAGSSNAFNGKYDGWNVSAQTNPCRIGLSGNAYMNLSRHDLINNAAAGYVAHFANAGSTSALYSHLNAQTATTATAGTSGAPPAQVAGYQRVFINGVSAKIPYYGV